MGSRRPCIKDEAIGKKVVVRKFVARGPSAVLVWNCDETRPCWAVCMCLNCAWRHSSTLDAGAPGCGVGGHTHLA
jgi:hypothetical protein